MKSRFLIETDGTFVPLKGTHRLVWSHRRWVEEQRGGGLESGGGDAPALKGPSDLTPPPSNSMTMLTVQPVVPLARGLYYDESRLGLFGLFGTRCCYLVWRQQQQQL